ncbi:MAG: acetoin utilization protein AcuC [Pseudomonadota bacterium]
MTRAAMQIYRGAALAAYGFGDPHPFGTDRHDAFFNALTKTVPDSAYTLRPPARAGRHTLALFHTDAYIERVRYLSQRGGGWLDDGDTPAFRGVYEAASNVVGASVAAADAIMRGDTRRAFVPIAGLHHARRDGAAGFCVFNDCGVVIEHLRRNHGLTRVAYVDIDAHHGDGVFYGFESDPDVCFVDVHEDGHHLYPGTGHRTETGSGEAVGTKLNLPLPPGADDEDFYAAWREAERFLDQAQPEFIVLQCGADAIAGDPITHLALTPAAYRFAAERLALLADRHAAGRLLATGGGGYNRENIGAGWSAVVAGLVGNS